MCSLLSWCWQPLVALMMTISMQLQQNVQLVKKDSLQMHERAAKCHHKRNYQRRHKNEPYQE